MASDTSHALLSVFLAYWQDAIESCKQKGWVLKVSLDKTSTPKPSGWANHKCSYLSTELAHVPCETSEKGLELGSGLDVRSSWELQKLTLTWRFFIKLKAELTYGPAVPLLAIYPEKNMIPKDACTPVFTAALFKTWKHLNVHRQRSG